MIIIQKHLEFYCNTVAILALAANAITDFTIAYAITDLFNIKEKITGETDDNGKKKLK